MVDFKHMRSKGYFMHVGRFNGFEVTIIYVDFMYVKSMPYWYVSCT